jgi:hypothetical protein
MEQLIIHNSDTQVKPIIGNKEIEKQDSTLSADKEVKFNPNTLSFSPMTPD